MTLGLLFTIVFVGAVIPVQGHGWGYRYVHGELGSVCLLAGLEMSAFLKSLATPVRERAIAGFLFIVIFGGVALVGVRAAQAHEFAKPFVAAERKIAAMRTEVVIVDDRDTSLSEDLVQNDPYLTNRPLILAYSPLKPGRLTWVCRHFSVSIFTFRDLRRAGIPRIEPAIIPAQAPTCETESVPSQIVSDRRRPVSAIP